MPEHEDSQPTITAGVQGEELAAISRGMVKLHAKWYGRGPTKARTFRSGDALTCVLENTLLPAERTLVARGEARTVLNGRMAFQRALAEEFRRVVEDVTGRRVISFLSAVDPYTDFASETFVLKPLLDGRVADDADAAGLP